MRFAINVIVTLCLFVGVQSSAEATIVVKVAEVQNGLAVVQGNKAVGNADIFWEGAKVTQANKGGSFSFSGAVPSDCVGTLSDGTIIDVVVLNCMPVSKAPAPVLQTGQTLTYASGDDGQLKKGIVIPTPRFTDNGNGSITDNATGLIWLKRANCFGTRTWSQALSDIANLADGQCGLSDGTRSGDWRLPNIRELLSLVHYGFSSPALSNAVGTAKWSEGDAFTGVQSSYYWTSTTRAIFTSEAWTVHFLEGLVFAGTESSPEDLLGVRGTLR